MNAKKFLVRCTATVGTAAVGAVGASAAFNIALWKTASTAAAMAAFPILKKLLAAAEDGEITAEEADAALEKDK